MNGVNINSFELKASVCQEFYFLYINAILTIGIYRPGFSLRIQGAVGSVQAGLG